MEFSDLELLMEIIYSEGIKHRMGISSSSPTIEDKTTWLSEYRSFMKKPNKEHTTTMKLLMHDASISVNPECILPVLTACELHKIPLEESLQTVYEREKTLIRKDIRHTDQTVECIFNSAKILFTEEDGERRVNYLEYRDLLESIAQDPAQPIGITALAGWCTDMLDQDQATETSSSSSSESCPEEPQSEGSDSGSSADPTELLEG